MGLSDWPNACVFFMFSQVIEILLLLLPSGSSALRLSFALHTAVKIRVAFHRDAEPMLGAT